MAEEAPEQGQEQTEGTQEDARIPKERFDQINKRYKDTAEQLAAVQAELKKIQDAGKSEAERERDRANQAESLINQLRGEVTDLKKGSWVRSAATEFKFHDPEDSVRFLNLGELEDERDARTAVERLARTKPHLVQSETTEQRPQIGKVLGNGQQEQGQGLPFQLTPEQAAVLQKRQQEEQLGADLAKALAEFQGKNAWSTVGGR